MAARATLPETHRPRACAATPRRHLAQRSSWHGRLRAASGRTPGRTLVRVNAGRGEAARPERRAPAMHARRPCKEGGRCPTGPGRTTPTKAASDHTIRARSTTATA